jgi:hypothetical protein
VAQHGPQDGGVVDADVALDGDLHDAVDVVLDGVLDGHDLDLGVLDLRQHRVERRGLARPGRTREQHDAVRELRQVRQHLAIALPRPQRGEVEAHRALVEHAQDGALARRRGQRRDAQVHRSPVDRQLDPPVLRQLRLRDVEVAHDLDARDERSAQVGRRRLDLVERTVDAVADAELVGEELEVHVARAVEDGPVQDRVEQPSIASAMEPDRP